MSEFQVIVFNDTKTAEIVNNVFGWTAGVICVVLLIPQLIHVWKTKSSKDLSMWFLGFNEICTMLYVCYGILIGSYAIAITDSLIFGVNTSLIISKVILDKRTNELNKVNTV